MWIPFYLCLQLLLRCGCFGHALAYRLFMRWTFSRYAWPRTAAKVMTLLEAMPSCPRCHMALWPGTPRCIHCALLDDLADTTEKAEPQPIIHARRRDRVWFSVN